MLSFLRRHGKSKAIKILYLAIAVSFIIGFGAAGYVVKRMRRNPQQFEQDTWVAKVDGVEIDMQTLNTTVRGLERQYRDMFGEASAQLLKQMDLPALALEKLISERIVEKVAADLGLVVTDTELADTIYRMSAFQENGRFNRQRYVEVLRRYRMTPVQFENEHRRELLAQKLRQLIASTVKVADSEVYEEFLSREDKVNLRFVKLVDKEIANQIQLTDEEVQAHFAANKDKFKVPEKRKVNYLELRAEDFEEEINITDAEIENYYQQHADQYKHEEEVHARHILIKVDEGADEATLAAAQKKAEDLVKQLRAGGDFAKLAQTNSDDPGSALRGGDLGWFGRGKMVPEFENAAFSMPIKQISDPVKSNFGFHIIEVLEKREPGTQTLDSVRSEIKDALAKEKAGEAMKKKADELFGLLKPEEDLLQFGSARNLRVSASSAFTANEPVPGIMNGMRASQLIFSMKEKEIGQPFATPAAVYIFQLTGIIEPHDASFDEVKDRVREDLRQTKINEVLQQRAQQIIAQVQGGATLAAVAARMNLEVQETGLFSRGNASIPKIGMVPELVAAAFAAPPGLLTAPYRSGNGMVVCELIEHQKPTDEDFAKKKDEIRESLVGQKAQVTLQAWVQQAQKTVTIERNEPVLQRLRGLIASEPAEAEE